LRPDDVDELKAKRLCHRCVGDEYLSNEMKSEGKRAKCSYCGCVRRAYSIGKLAERIDAAFGQHYTRTSDQPTSWQYTLLSDKESDYEWERDGEPVAYAIMNAADIPEAAAEDIQKILENRYGDFDAAAIGEETEFSSESYYEGKGASDAAWQEEWWDFERSLKTEARFFSRTAAKHLASVFDGIDMMQTRDGRPLLVEAGPGTALSIVYRARVFQSDERLQAALCRPDQHLGSPPSLLAGAGRMNARGISVFYGANDPKVALAEVRPPVGSQVAVARFEIIRPIRLLDLTALSTVSSGGSIFDPELAGRLERAVFLRSLSRRITRPVMPDDEVFEYLPTQAVADFLATEASVPVDGIIFSSVQAAGNALNIVLFHKAARVETLDFPAGTEISASQRSMDEDGWEVEYSVLEQVPPKADEDQPHSTEKNWPPDFGALAALSWEQHDGDVRDATLRIVVDSVKVHRVSRVQFETDEYDVKRHRWEKHEPPF
jgi:RES domain